MKIHITGASGAGTTTLGRVISDEFHIHHFDTDDFFWEPSDPLYQFSRKKKDRQKLLKNELRSNNQWVLSGSLCGWGDFTIPLFDLIIYLWVPTEIRLERLKLREISKFGQKSLAPGGAMYENHEAFMKWASDYEKGNLEMRSKARHEAWLRETKCEVIKYEGVVETDTIIKDLTSRFKTLAALSRTR